MDHKPGERTRRGESVCGRNCKARQLGNCGANAICYSFEVDMSPLNLDRLQDWIDQGRLDPSKPITVKELHDSRCLHGVKDGVKLLARVSSASGTARATR